MTRALALALDKLKELPEERQNEIAGLILCEIALPPMDDDFTPEEWAKIEAALARIDRGEVLSVDDTELFLRKYGA
jgi:hypothetical protein